MNCQCAPRSILRFTLFCVTLVGLLLGPPLFAKTAVDFNPNLDFSKYKTFAYLGGVENLLTLQLDPDIINDRIRHVVDQELSKRGLREIQPGQNPDLVVRYWANPSEQVNVTTMGNWAPYAPYTETYWAWIYKDVTASSAKEGSLVIDLIDAKFKDLAWRVYLIRKITTSEKDWRKANEELSKAFESFPPSANEREAKKRERAAHPAKSD